MVKILYSLMVIMLMAGSCSTSYSYLEGQTGFDDGTPHEWPEGYPKEGFQPHSDHEYGFDFSPNFPDKINALEDDIAYVSVPTNGVGYVSVFTDSTKITENVYYYCNPDNYNDTSMNVTPVLEINSYTEEKTALCKKSSDNVPIKIHELHTYRYELKKDYNFSAYIWGDRSSSDLKHSLVNIRRFWDEFNKTYRQAIVEHGRLSNEYLDFPMDYEYEDGLDGSYLRPYFLTRAKGSYNGCAIGDIDRFMDTIEYNAEYRRGERRVIIQLGFPAKRFWPLRLNNSNKIELCGSPDLAEGNPKNMRTLKLEPHISDERRCTDSWVWDATVTWNQGQGVWILDYGNGNKEIADRESVNPACAVFVDTTSQTSAKYIEEITGDSTVAQAKDKGKATVIILPWLGEMTTRTAIHELGHTMGLTDVNDANLSNSITNDSKEGNLMHSSTQRKGFKLRKRGMHPSDTKDCASKGVNCVESQWDCLHKKNDACSVPNLDPYLR